ncbi:MAG TPA: CARDB domain-containing protein [Pirellulales bacterium]|nr:CARDB domain-containing protein [Pirellulales bacterium]
MRRQIALLALIVSSVVAAGTAAARAQDSDSDQSVRPPTLSDRLEQFRDDLLGTPNYSNGTQKTKKMMANGSPNGQANVSPNGNSSGPPRVPGQVGASVSSLDGNQKPASAGKANAPVKTANANSAGPAGPSSRRTAQPNYKPSPAVSQSQDDGDSGDWTPPAAGLKQPGALADEADEPAAPSKPAKAGGVPLPKVARPTPRQAPSAGAEGNAMPEPAPRATARKVPSTVTPQSKPAPASKDVLLSGRTPSLAIEATGPRKVMIGREAVFKVNLQNAGDIVAASVRVSIDIPAGAEIVDVQTTAGTNQPQPPNDAGGTPLEWEIPRLAGHAHETMTLKLIPRQNAPIDLGVRWACMPESSQMSVEVQEPKLAMSLSGPTEVLYGQSRTYKLIISNPGNGDAENVMVSLMPIGRAAEAAASHRLGSLPAGGSKSIEVELTARQAGELAIRAQATAEGGLAAEVAEQVLVRRANLQLDVEGPKVKYSGTKGTYHIRLVNTGNAVAEGVNVAALLPPQAVYQGASSGGHTEGEKNKVVWSAVNMQPGEERVLELQCLLQAPGENKLQVATSASQDLAVSANAVTVVESLADLKLEVHDPQGPIATGEDAVYEVIVRNRGTKGAENVDVVLFFSTGLEATAVQGGPHEIGPGQVVLKSIASLPAGSEKVYKIHTRAERAGSHIFRAEVVCAPLDIKLTSEQSTRFYGDDADGSSAPMTARRPAALEDTPTRQ